MSDYYDNASVCVRYEPWALCECYDFNFGNVLKYVLRARYKGCLLQDLKKALSYLEHILAEFAEDDGGMIAVSPTSYLDHKMLEAFARSNPGIKVLCHGVYNGVFEVGTLLMFKDYLKRQIAGLEFEQEKRRERDKYRD